MCFQFAKSSGDYDFISPLTNLFGNGLVLGCAGVGTTLIVALALKALGYSGAAIAIGTALPIIAATVGFATAAASFFVIPAIVYVIISA